MLRLAVSLLVVLACVPAAQAARAVPPANRLLQRVLDGCPPGYVRDLMADCRLVRPSRALGASGYGATASTQPAPTLSYGAMRPIPQTPTARRPAELCPAGFRFSPRSGQCRPDDRAN